MILASIIDRNIKRNWITVKKITIFCTRFFAFFLTVFRHKTGRGSAIYVNIAIILINLYVYLYIKAFVRIWALETDRNTKRN